ncbi:MAG: transposase [Caldilineaceae bacterium]
MRLPIVDYPEIVRKNLCEFEEVFHTPEQKKHFCEYVTGLIAGDEATVKAINGLFLDKNDQSALNKFIVQAEWDEQGLNKKRVEWELSRLKRRPLSAEAGRLILDDTLAHHTHCQMEGLAYLYDHSLGYNVWAHDVVTSYYVNRSDQFPVDLRLYRQFRAIYEKQALVKVSQAIQKEASVAHYRDYLANLLSYHYRQQAFRTKTELSAELVQQAIAYQLPFEVVLFDSWFLRWSLVEPIQTAGKDWIGGCPKDRKVLFQNQWMQLQEYIRTIPAEAYHPYSVGDHCYWVFTKVVPMQALDRQRVRILASYQDHLTLDKTPNFYATNRKDWEPLHILQTYADRWPTETFNEDVKEQLGFEDYQLHQVRSIRRHWYLSWVAYSLLSDQAPPGRSRWRFKDHFQSTGQRCQAVVNELLALLVHWIAQQLHSGGSPDSILAALLQ